MTIMQMLQEGMVLNLIGMGVLFVLMGMMLSAIGGKKNSQPDVSSSSAAKQKTDNMPTQTGFEVTAAITAAVNEYRKTTN
jgi:Na+-transporting methylmalonyl-CoA/oxaloacetate decarboxylase gamma subunit